MVGPSMESQNDVSSILLGAILSAFAALTMAFSYVLQRYALSYPDEMVPFCCSCAGERPRLNRMHLWFLGLVVGGGANVLQTAGLSFAPLTTCSAVFATVVVFNLFFAKLFLGEEFSNFKIGGSVLVLAGGIACALSSPAAAGKFTADEAEAFVAAPTAWCCFFVFVGILCPMMVQCFCFEKQFPFDNLAYQDVHQHPQTLFKVMGFIYPCSLGIIGGLVQLGLKGLSVMLSSVLAGSDDLTHPAFWYFLACVVFFTIFWLGWLALVYRRCETSKALPIEYGAVTVVSMCSGILFFQEYKLMDAHQLLTMTLGILIVTVGIALCSGNGSLELRRKQHSSLEQRREQSRELMSRELELESDRKEQEEELMAPGDSGAIMGA